MKVSDIYGGCLKADDLDGKDATVTIRGGELRELEDKKRLQISFEEPLRPLILNVTNARQIARLHGEEATQWIGKRIVLYPTTCDFGGKTVKCVRVRETTPEPQSPPQQPANNVGGAVRF